jgi:large subunit ribosomal protein L28
MAKCDLTGKRPSFGNNVSFSKRATRRRWNPNVHKRRVFVPEIGEFVTLKLSTKALKTITKKGLVKAFKDEGFKIKDLM